MIVICTCDDNIELSLNKKYNVINTIHSKLTNILYYEIKNDNNRICFENQNKFITLKEHRKLKITKLINIL
jgi:hypothetical protein